MKSRTIPILCLIVFFAQVAYADKVAWHTDLSKAKIEAGKTGKPILLDFTASWCGPCKAMDREFWVRPDVVALSKKIIFVKIDSDRNADLKRQYSVRGIPHVSITDVWGLELAFHVGYLQRASDEIVDKIASVPTGFGEVLEAGNLLERNSNDLSSLAAMARFYQQRKFFQQSNEFYFRILELEKDPKQRESLFLNLGFNFLSLGKLSESQDLFTKFQRDFPKSKYLDMALHGEIFTLVQMRKISLAEKLFDRLKSDYPKSLMISHSNQVISDAKLN